MMLFFVHELRLISNDCCGLGEIARIVPVNCADTLLINLRTPDSLRCYELVRAIPEAASQGAGISECS
jgi:hypothetical protein